MELSITLLGTGTSQGVPVIGCGCAVCQSHDPRDKRLRTSALLAWGDQRIVIDAGPDFRQQMLREGVDRLDSVLLTHEHNDHMIGLDDIRPFNFAQGGEMPVYGLARVLNEVRERFAYVFSPSKYPGAPSIQPHTLSPEAPVIIKALPILPLAITHGKLPILGYKIGPLVYITDASSIPPQTFAAIQNCHTLILNALHREPHHSHFNLEQAIATAQRIGAQETYLTHISHYMGTHASTTAELPEGIHLGYDGLKLTIPIL